MRSDPEKTELPSLQVRAEAAAWLAMLRGPNRNSETDRGFQRWRQASPSHERAFELLSERIEWMEALRARPLPARWRRKKKRSSSVRTMLQAVAACALVMAAGIFFLAQDRRVSTAVGEQRTLTLPDGSLVSLNTDTQVIVRYDANTRNVELARGEALFEVAREPDRPFVVTAGHRRIKALGTTFVVRRLGEEFAVTLVEGKVAVTEAGGERPRARAISTKFAQEYTLTRGQRITFTPVEPPHVDEPSIETVTAWRQGQVAFDDMLLPLAAAEMNRYSDVKLVVESARAAELRVGGFFRMGDSMSFARAVATTYCLQVLERPGEIVLIDPRDRDERKGGVGSADRCV